MIDLTPLVKSIERARRSSWVQAGICLVAALASFILGLNRGWLGALAAGGVGLAAAAGWTALAFRRWRVGIALQSLLAVALATVMLGMGGAAVASVWPGSENPDSEAALGLLMLLLFLGVGLSDLLQGIRAARFLAYSDLGRQYQAAVRALGKQRLATRPRSWKPGRRAWGGAASGTAAVACLVAFLISFYRELPTRGSKPIFAAGNPWVLWAGILTCAAAIHLIRQDRRLRAVPALQLVGHHPQAPLLFLRSFGDDSLRLKLPLLAGIAEFQDLFVSLRGIRFEEFVASRLSGVGSVIAIGRPGEPLPELGAARGYFAHADWQDAIRDWMQRSQRVLMVVGRTEGVGWEFEELRRLGLQDKLILLFPPESAAARCDRWRRFCAHAAAAMPPGLEDLEPAWLLAVRFCKSGPPRVFASRRTNFWACDSALLLAFDDFEAAATGQAGSPDAPNGPRRE